MMDQFNLNLYVEQVNHKAETAVLEKWEEEQALGSVVDPNTEFKTWSCNRVSPTDSYGLDVSPPAPRNTKQQGLAKRRQKRHSNDSSQLAQVHAYGSSHSNTPIKEMKSTSADMSITSSQESLQPVSNSEQLTWILQRARDRLDTASNISGCSSRFELDSNCSEKMSTISDVSGYEEEMYRIKRLLLLDSTASTPTPVPTPVHREKYDTEVHKLTMELQKVRAEWQEKHQEALRQKAHTEGRLETMQVDMLECRDQESVLKAEVTKLQHSVRDLSAQIELKDVEVHRLRSESQNLEQENERLRIELQEVQIDVESKEGAISGLKSKVADQHVEFQDIYQAKLKAENSLSSLQNEIESLRKSNLWYRDQLHACQSAKMKIQQELMGSQSSTVSLMHQLEKLKGECAGLRLMTEQTQLQAVREKEVLMRKLEAIQADMMEREAIIMTHTETLPAVVKQEENCNLQEFKDQVSSLMLQVQAKEVIVNQMESENTELMTRLTVAQKMLNEKEVAIQMLENKFRNLEMSHNQLIDTLKTKEDVLLEAKNGKVTADVALAAAEREKAEVDAAVTKLRDDFTRITQSYKSMKEEVREKEKKITDLITKMNSTEKEKNKLKEEVDQCKEIQSQILQLKSYESEIGELSESNQELSNKVREITEANNYIKGKLANVEEALAAREEQLLNQSHSLEVQRNEINLLQSEKESKEKELEVLSATNTNLTAKNNEMNERLLNLENNLRVAREKLSEQQNEIDIQIDEKHRLVSQIHELTDHSSSLQKQLASANAAIEQFNLLCRQSEQDRHHISDELQKVLRENASLRSTADNGLITPGTHRLNELKELELLTVMNDTPNLKHELPKLTVMQQLLSKATNTNRSVSLQTDNGANCVSAETQTGSILKTVERDSQTDNGAHYDQTQALERQIVNLKASLKMSELEQREKYRRYETNIRTLLKKVKEHMKGRKTAERALEELKEHGEVARLQAELEEMQRLANINQHTILELEKERGKLVQTQDDTSPDHRREHVAELEEEIHKSHIIIKDLRKEVFSDKCEISQLKKQVGSLQMGLETANDMLDAKKVELGKTESWCHVLRTEVTHVKKELEMEQQSHEECKQELAKLVAQLEESKAKDPVLADQLKTLSYHLHQKNQEITSLEEKLRLSEERWQGTEDGLRLNIGALQDEMKSLHSELELVRKDKVALQKHATELRTALCSSMENNKTLRAKLEKYEFDSTEKMPDLTSSLPMPLLEYDETKIAELLHQSSMLPRSKPLSNLQACLDSLKQEMATLQQQLIARATSKQTGAP